MRIDDLDAPRVVEDAEDAILRAIEAHGLEWDGAIVRQSGRREAYAAALDALTATGLCFYCTCSRRTLATHPIYPGTCRARTHAVANAAIRVRVGGTVEFHDRIQGRHREDLAAVTGDFVVFRRDGFAAYQLAVVVDDAAAGVTHIVRGADLLDNTPRQLYLQGCLGLTTPVYAHVPVVREASGAKLSKHDRATAIGNRFAVRNLQTVLQLLGQPTPATNDVRELLGHAIEHWSIDRMPSAPSIEGYWSI